VWHEAFTDSRERDPRGRAGDLGLHDRLRRRRIEQQRARDASRTAYGVAFYKHGGCASGRNAGECQCDRQRRKRGKLGLGSGEQFAQRRHFAICSRRRRIQRNTLFGRWECAQAGTYPASVVATNGTQTTSQSFVLVIAIVASIGNSVDTTLGVGGKFEQFISTSFQPAEWDYQFFQNHAATEPALLNKLGPQHIRLQGLSQAVPMKANTGSATDWDFSILDAIVQPVLTVGDNSPEFQIAAAPAFLNDPASGHLFLAQQACRLSPTTVRTWSGTITRAVSPGAGRISFHPALRNTRSHGGASITNTTSTA